MPADPQSILATLLALFAAAWLLRAILPIPILSKRHRRAKSPRHVKLTIKGQPPS